MTGARRSRTTLVAGATAALVLVIVGVIVIVHIASGSGSSTTGLRPVIDAAPLPAGTEKVGETDNSGAGDTTPQIERRYRLSSASAPTEDIEQVLVAARYRVLDQQSGKLADVPDGAWGTSVTATSGDVIVLPPGRTGGGIAYLWRGDQLWLTVRDGAIDG